MEDGARVSDLNLAFYFNLVWEYPLFGLFSGNKFPTSASLVKYKCVCMNREWGREQNSALVGNLLRPVLNSVLENYTQL